MKVRFLLCMMALWAICAAAQPQMPRVLEDGFRLMPNPHQFTVKPMKAADKAEKGIAAKTTKATKRTKARADEATYQVNFVLDFDTECQKAYQIALENKDVYIDNYEQDIWELVKGSNVLTVPAGTYDILVEFNVLDTTQDFEWPSYNLYVIREQVTIDQNMTLNFASSEAKNHIHFQTLTIDGEPVYTGKWEVDENWNWTQLEAGNTEDVFAISQMVCPEIGLSYTISGNIGSTVVGDTYHMDCQDKGIDFFVNDVSERYTFFSHRVAIANGAIYSSAYETQGASGNVTITNDPAKFTLFEDPFLVSSRPGEERYRSFNFFSRLEGAFSMHGTQIASTIPLAEGQTCKYYIGASTEDSQLGYIPTIEPSVSVKTIEVIDYGDGEIYEHETYTPVMYSMPIAMSDGKLMFANNGTGGRYSLPGPSFSAEPSEELDWLGRDINVYPYWPTHPVFSYDVSKKKDNLGNNCPLLVSDAHQYEITFDWEDEEGNPVSETYRNMEIGGSYLGRYGETPEYTATVSIQVNGEDYAGPFYGMESLINGDVDVTFANDSVVVDDMVGSNMAQLHYTAGAEDENPPTMTMLGFRANNGDITDRFATADEGTLEFSAGDFNFVLTPQNYGAYNRQTPESVEVSYSPYGEDNWNELAVEEVPENYWPVMGWFYMGSLAGVTGEALNGWFDLKIRLTDAAGNWQEQVLSPAFRIDDLAYSSVANVGKDNAREVARYSIDGKRVDANHRGVTIVKMSDGTARKILVP